MAWRILFVKRALGGENAVMSGLESAFGKPQIFTPSHCFFLLWKYTKLHTYQKLFRPTLFQQRSHHPLEHFHFSPSCTTISVSLSLSAFCLSYFLKHVEKPKAYALALILTFKGNASCRAKTLCSPDQSLTLFSASSISKCQNIFASVRFISAHAKLLPNIIP